MATAYLTLPPLAAKPDIDSPPQLSAYESTAAEPNPEWMVWLFDGTTAEYIHYQFRMPGDYASAPSLTVLWQSSATTNAVVWTARVGAITAADADTPQEHAAGTVNSATATNNNTTEANRLNTTTWALTNADSVAAGDLVDLIVGRNPADAGDTSTVDAGLLMAELSYTTV